MSEMSPGAALRQLQQAQAVLRQARQALRSTRTDPGASPDLSGLLRVGWEALAQAHRLLASLPLSAATDPVMTKQLAVQRYATALLVRLRRLARRDPSALEGDDEDSFDVDEYE